MKFRKHNKLQTLYLIQRIRAIQVIMDDMASKYSAVVGGVALADPIHHLVEPIDADSIDTLIEITIFLAQNSENWIDGCIPHIEELQKLIDVSFPESKARIARITDPKRAERIFDSFHAVDVFYLENPDGRFKSGRFKGGISENS